MQFLPPPRRGAPTTWEVRSAAEWLIVTRIALATACVAGPVVGVLSCFAADASAEDWRWESEDPTRDDVLGIFVRATIAEALVAFVLAAAVMRFAVRDVGREGAVQRVFVAGGAAGALHILVYPLAVALVSVPFDAGSGSTSSIGSNVGLFVLPMFVAAVPLGLVFGAAYRVVLRAVATPLQMPSGATLSWCRGVTSVALLAALAIVCALQTGNRLETGMLALPRQLLVVTLVLDIVATVANELRARTWLRALRRGHIAGWRLVPIAEASVAADLAPWSTSSPPTLAVVPSQAATYRNQPIAVAVLAG